MHFGRVKGRKRRSAVQGKNFGRKLIRQVILCIVLVLLVIAVKKLDITIMNRAMETFHVQLEKDYKAAEIGTAVKSAFLKVKDGTVKIAAGLRAGEKNMAFIPPADAIGTLTVSASGSGKGKSIQYQADQEIQVYASAGGTVIEIGEDAAGGKYVIISHGNKITSFYSGCSDVYVKTLEKVRKGQLIGTVKPGADKYLSFGIRLDGELTDPADYIEF